ncbi:hypothetical protein DYI37_06510 [Fulvimarina endophytica]|uniref:Protein BatD n=1 Tax=Fulvimarina endophytica TaxID=2293836 RepID=A0A371X8A9_9HYPH|nr:BatD family protein [Fulvimarina endophytica]RFC65462.1 hypothetical protein DYI37_06510 [Fulvimarina endophytica]
MVTAPLARALAALVLLAGFLFHQGAAPANAAPQVEDGATRLVVEIEAGSPTPYVGEMILVTITGYYDVTVALEKFQGIELPNFTWLQLGRDVWSKARVDGREFTTVTRRLAIYGEKAGLQHIGPFTHHLTLTEGKSTRFLHDVVSNTVDIVIEPKPRTNGDWWFPASSAVLTDEWDMDPSKMANGATATRTITITAAGQPGEALPNPPYMSAPWLISFIAPEERSTEITPDGPIGKVTWRWRLRPSDSEPGRIRAFHIPWFDTVDRTMRDLTIDSQDVAFALVAETRRRESAKPDFTGLAVPLILGLIVPVVAILPGRRLLSMRSIRSRLSARLPSRDDIGLRLALWRGDARAYRRHAARLLADPAGPDHAERAERTGRALAELDHALYAKGADGAAVNLRDIHRRMVSPELARRGH